MVAGRPSGRIAESHAAIQTAADELDHFGIVA
jgi:hypothetical protein